MNRNMSRLVTSLGLSTRNLRIDSKACLNCLMWIKDQEKTWTNFVYQLSLFSDKIEWIWIASVPICSTGPVLIRVWGNEELQSGDLHSWSSLISSFNKTRQNQSVKIKWQNWKAVLVSIDDDHKHPANSAQWDTYLATTFFDHVVSIGD